ncbi:MAG: NosD domain-containing protein [Promethearchaeota archaeon]
MKPNLRKMCISLIELMLIVGFLYFHNSGYLSNSRTDNYVQNDDITDVKISGTYANITIDNLPGSWNNWEWAKTQIWCSGLGTSENPYIIQGHTLEIDNTNDGIKISNSYDIYFTIKYCTFIWIGGIYTSGTAIYLDNSTDGLIINNTIQEIDYGIDLNDCENINITKNTIYNSYVGISLSQSNFSGIQDNKVHGSENGIGVSYSNHNSINNNTVTNFEYGMYISHSEYNDIFENIAYDHVVGIFLGFSSDFNTIIENNLYNNVEYGIRLEGSNNNIIYKNFFLENEKHAIDEGSDNIWNSTIIGNYWDNHTGPDVNNDGIVDTPYIFIAGPANSKDYLPIAEPRIIIKFPNPRDAFGSIAPSFDLEIIDAYFLNKWYTIDNGLNNYTFTENGKINQTAWDTMVDGLIKLKFYASNIAGNITFAEVNIIKDTVAPTIVIDSPLEGKKFGKKAPSFILNVTDVNLDTIWYSLDEGVTNFTVNDTGTINQATWAALANGEVTITFYARDLAGNEVSVSVTIIKSAPRGLEPGAIAIIVVFSIIGGLVIIGAILGILLKTGKISLDKLKRFSFRKK